MKEETPGVFTQKCMICGWGAYFLDVDEPMKYCPKRYCRALLFEHHDGKDLRWLIDEDYNEVELEYED